MANDDYHVIVYRILQYLYACLKAGMRPDKKEIEPDGNRIPIEQAYWEYIMLHMLRDGLIEGAAEIRTHGGTRLKLDPDFNISPKGIEYLKDNSLMKRIEALIGNPIVKAAGGVIEMRL